MTGREGEEGNGEGKKTSGKGILAIPILVCFRRRCSWLMYHVVLQFCTVFHHIHIVTNVQKHNTPVVHKTNTGQFLFSPHSSTV